MKKTLLSILLLSSPLIIKSQSIENSPWNYNLNKRGSKTTLNEISQAAEKYFSTIDRNKKGSGLKPFKRWEYHWSNYLLKDGTIAPSSDLWKAWNQKNELNTTSSRVDNSNWLSLGPHTNSNRYSASNFKQTGQGRINVVVVDPNDSNTYYVGSPAGGIWKSTNKGSSWTPLTDYLPQIGVSGIAIDPNNSNIIYIATGDDDANDSYSVGVYKSTDGGTTWASTGAIPGNPNSMNDIYVDPNNSQTIIVATSTGVQKSVNGGTSWSTKLSGNIRDLKVKPGDFNTMYAASSTTIYRSSNAGDSFSSVSIPGFNGSRRIAIDVTSANSNYVYFVSANNSYAFNGVYKSTNSGVSFSKTSQASDIFGSTQAWYDLDITVSSNNPDIVYVGVLDIWKSVNGGNSFTKINSWSNPNTDSYTHADIHYLSSKNNLLFAGTDGGVFVSDNEGTKFTDLTAGLAISQFYKISISPQKPNTVAGGLQDNGGYSFNDGAWRNYHGGDGMEGLISPVNPSNVYGFMQYGANLFSSNDGGLSLSGGVGAPAAETNAATNDDGGRWVTPLASNSQGELYAGYSQLYKLVNGSWNKISNHSFGGDLYNIEIDPNNSNNIYVSRGTTSYKSTNGGTTFSTLYSAPSTIQSIEVSNTDSNIAWVVTSTSVYKTTNLLATTPSFSNITNNLPSEGKTVIKHHARSGNNTIYLGTNLGVYYTNDDLSNQWETFDNNLPNTQVADLEVDEEESVLYAGTYGRGVFYSTIPRMIPAKDVKLVAITNPNNSLTPSTGFNCGSDFTPQIEIKNAGSDPITSVNITYKVDNGTNQNHTWNGNLTSDQTTMIDLPLINSTFGSHNLNVTITTNNDAYQSNNSTSVDFLINESNNSPTTVNTFDNTGDDLLVTTSNQTMWELGTASKTLLSSSSKVYVTKLSGNHPDGTKGYLHSKCYDLTKISDPILRFKMAFDIETDWDHMYVEYTLDKGATWNILGTANDANWYNSSSTANGLPGKQWTGLGEEASSLGGKNADMHEYSYNLSAYTNQTNFSFRFVFLADAGVNEEGAMIDDLVITGTTLSIDDNSILKNVSIYPNPSDSIFNIHRNTSDDLDIQVYDITGKEIFKQKNITSTKYQLNMSNFASGMYFVKLQSNGKHFTQKLILN